MCYFFIYVVSRAWHWLRVLVYNYRLLKGLLVSLVIGLALLLNEKPLYNEIWNIVRG